MLSRQGTEPDQQISGTQGLEPLMLLGSIVMLDYLNGDNRRNIMKQSKFKQNCQMMIESLKALNDTWNQAQTAESVSQKFTGAFNILQNRFLAAAPAAESTNVAEIQRELARHFELSLDIAKPIDLSNLDFAHYLNQEIAFSKRIHTGGGGSVSDFYSATFSRIWSFLIENFDHVVNDSGYTCFFSAVCYLHHFSSIKEQSGPDASKASSYQPVYQILDQITDLASYSNPVSGSLIQEFKNKFKALAQVIQDSGVGALEMLQQASSQCQQLLSGENIVSINDLKTIVEKQVLNKIDEEATKEGKVMTDKANGSVLQRIAYVVNPQSKFTSIAQGSAYVALKAYFVVNQLQLVQARSQQELQVAVAETTGELKHKLTLQANELDLLQLQIKNSLGEIAVLKNTVAQQSEVISEARAFSTKLQERLVESEQRNRELGALLKESQQTQMQLNEGAKGILEELKKVRSEKMSLESNLTELQSDLTDLQEAYQQQVAGRSGGPKKSETSSALSARSANSLFGPNK